MSNGLIYKFEPIDLLDIFKFGNTLFHGSKIICSVAEINKIINFFPKTIKGVKLLYRASDNGFSVERFHEKCDGIANTLTLVWTEFDRKIGGFTS
jgi:hypothetical protein